MGPDPSAQVSRRPDMEPMAGNAAAPDPPAACGAGLAALESAMTIMADDGPRPFDRFPEVTDFLAAAGKLAPWQKRRIVQQAQILLEQLYVPMSFKPSLLPIHPVQRLKMLEFN